MNENYEKRSMENLQRKVVIDWTSMKNFDCVGIEEWKLFLDLV